MLLAQPPMKPATIVSSAAFRGVKRIITIMNATWSIELDIGAIGTAAAEATAVAEVISGGDSLSL